MNIDSEVMVRKFARQGPAVSFRRGGPRVAERGGASSDCLLGVPAGSCLPMSVATTPRRFGGFKYVPHHST
jgi:hypothetical protein